MTGLVAAPAADAATARPATTYYVQVWANNVNVRHVADPPSCEVDPGTQCTVMGQVNAGTYLDICQEAGESITYDGYTSNYWTQISTSFDTGWISNVFLVGPAVIPGVPIC